MAACGYFQWKITLLVIQDHSYAMQIWPIFVCLQAEKIQKFSNYTANYLAKRQQKMEKHLT